MNEVATKTENRPTREAQSNGSQHRYVSPRVNVFETRDGYVLEAEMPGVTRDGLEIQLENSELTLIGRPHAEKIEAELVYRESTPRDFYRVFSIDPSIDTSKIEARLQDGLLKLTLPKAERVKPRRIKVSD